VTSRHIPLIGFIIVSTIALVYIHHHATSHNLSAASSPHHQTNAPSANTTPKNTPKKTFNSPNAPCLKCHTTFENELIAQTHEQAGMLCTECHGSSADHMTTTSPQMPPDKTFTRNTIEPFCQDCHDHNHDDDIRVKQFLDHWRGRRRPNGRRISLTNICTDCHGQHVITEDPSIHSKATPVPGLSAKKVDILSRVFTDRFPHAPACPETIHVPRGTVACFQFAVQSASNDPCICEVGPIASANNVPLVGTTKIYQLLPVHVEANNNGGSKTSAGKKPPQSWLNAFIREAPFDVAEVLIERNQLQIQPGCTGAAMLEVTVDPTTKPGLYHGVFNVRQNDNHIPLTFSLRVHETILPRQQSLSTTYWLSPNPKDLTNGQVPSWWSENHWMLLENTARVLHDFGQDSIRTPLINGPEPLIRTIRQTDGTYAFDFTRFDRWCTLFLNLGFQRLEGQHVGGSHQMGASPMLGGLYTWDSDFKNREPLFPKGTDKQAWLEFLPLFYDALFQRLQQMNWTNRYVQYLIDEAHDLKNYKKLTALTHKHMPGIKIQDAVNSRPADYSPMIDVHVFSLVSLARQSDLAHQRRQTGKSVWLYHCCSPYPPHPNRHLDERLTDSRLYPWLAFMFKADGYLYWAANMYRGADPYATSVGPVPNGSQNPGHPPGDNWMFYPGKNGLLASLRMVAFREGLTDHHLLTLLARHNPQQAEQIRKKIVRSITDYQKDAQSFHSARRELLEALDPIVVQSAGVNQ